MMNVFITVLFAMFMSFGQIVLSFASKDIFSKQKFSMKLLVFNHWLWVGLLIYAAAIVLWIYILSRFNLKYAYPIATTAIFFVAIYQSVVDKAFPSVAYWIGLLFVIIGITILSLSKN